MLFPSKLFKYSESVISGFPSILLALQDGPRGVKELYFATKGSFSNVSGFIDALDCLYALKKISLDSESKIKLTNEVSPC